MAVGCGGAVVVVVVVVVVAVCGVESFLAPFR
jgi:hypothetical protein